MAAGCYNVKAIIAIANKLNTARHKKLLARALPKLIETEEEYEKVADLVWELARKGEENLTPEEQALLDLLTADPSSQKHD